MTDRFLFPAAGACLAALLLAVVVPGCADHGEANAMKPSDNQQPSAPAEDTAAAQPSTNSEVATFGAGCFWGVEAAFRKVPGVTDTAVGYSGGTVDNPDYRLVCTDTTGHAEVVQVHYDPKVVSYEKLLEVFFSCHNPTQLNRQGPDFGKQYRSAIFYHTPEQRDAAEAAKQSLQESGKFDGTVVTEITSASTFWRAEEYHQQYLEKKGRASCGTGLGH